MSCYRELIWTTSLKCYRGMLSHPWHLRLPLDSQRLSLLLVCLSFLSPSLTFVLMAKPRFQRELAPFTCQLEPLAYHLRSSQSGALQATSDSVALAWPAHRPSSSGSPLEPPSSSAHGIPYPPSYQLRDTLWDIYSSNASSSSSQLLSQARTSCESDSYPWSLLQFVPNIWYSDHFDGRSPVSSRSR